MEDKKSRSKSDGIKKKIAPQDKYEPRFCEMLIEHMSEGYSFESFSTKTKVVKSTMYEWLKRHEEFAQAKSIAEDAALQLFESALHSKLTGRNKMNSAIGDGTKGDMTAIIFALKTRFHKVYGDKTKHEVSGQDNQAIKIDFVKNAK